MATTVPMPSNTQDPMTHSFLAATGNLIEGTEKDGVQSKVRTPPTIEKSTNSLQIINLSSVSLACDEINLLKKWLTFTPTPVYNPFTWVKDVKIQALEFYLERRKLLFKILRT